jgi:hypothetical protein
MVTASSATTAPGSGLTGFSGADGPNTAYAPPLPPSRSTAASTMMISFFFDLFGAASPPLSLPLIFAFPGIG